MDSTERKVTMERDFMGTIHIKVGDFDFIQIQYQHPCTDNAGTARLARKIMALLGPEKER